MLSTPTPESCALMRGVNCIQQVALRACAAAAQGQSRVSPDCCVSGLCSQLCSQ